MPEIPLPERLRPFAQAVIHLVSALPAVVPLLALPLAVWACHRVWTRTGNRQAARWVAALALVAGLSDGLLLAGLPRLNLSFGPVGLPWLGLILARAGLAWAACGAGRHWLPNRPGRAVALVWAANLAILAAAVYALYYEPLNLGVSHVHITLPGPTPARLRVVHLTDLHIERVTRRERAVLDAVEWLQPDLILLTGDYLNLSYVGDSTTRQEARELLGHLHAPYGVYAIPGTPAVDSEDAMASLFDGLANVTVLHDQAVHLEVEGQAICLLGVANLGYGRDRDALRTLAGHCPPGASSVLMYHKPDLAGDAAELGIDLYLAGHTHGGQVRLPWFGALVTASRYGKRYESGLYRVGRTQLYVSRGLGNEGLGAPRLRFLCPPEIVEIVVVWGEERTGALRAVHIPSGT